MHLRLRTERSRSTTGSRHDCLFLRAEILERHAWLACLVVEVLPDRQSVLLHQLTHFVERGLAEVLAGQQFLLADPGQVAEGVDFHRREAVAAADGEFEVGDRPGEELLHLLLLLERFLVVVHVAGGFDVLQVQPGPLVERIVLQNLLEAILGQP